MGYHQSFIFGNYEHTQTHRHANTQPSVSGIHGIQQIAYQL